MMSSNGSNHEMDNNVIHISKAYSLEKLSFFLSVYGHLCTQSMMGLSELEFAWKIFVL